LLTGKPGVGKTTAIIRIVERLQALGVDVAGFYTQEIRDRGKRVGFGITTVPDGRTGILSHVEFSSPHRIGRYRVDVAGFEAIVLPILGARDVDVLVIDEIGPMELLSRRFERAVLAALERPKPRVVGVVQQKRLALVEGIKQVRIYRLDTRNRDRAPDEIVNMLGYRDL